MACGAVLERRNLIAKAVLALAVLVGMSLLGSAAAAASTTPPPCPTGAPSGFPSLGAASQFTVFALNGAGTTQTANFSNDTVNGDVGVAAGAKVTNQAPSTINGNVLVDSAASFSGPGKVNGTILKNQGLAAARTSAINASAQAAALTPKVTLASVTADKPITGVSGLNVISITGNISLNNASLTLSGPSDAYFVVNVGGSIALVGTGGIKVGGSVPASHLLINMTKSGSSLINTHVGNVIQGILLGPKAGGSLDGTFGAVLLGANFSLMSGVNVTFHGCLPRLGLTTTATPASVVLGGSVVDVAHLTGGSNPVGKITFEAYDDAQCANQVFQKSVTVNGAGDYTSPPFTPPHAGTWYWRAGFTSATAANPSIRTACKDANETLTVTQPPLYVGYADTRLVPSGSGLPSPWRLASGVVFVGLVPGSGNTETFYDSGALRLVNPAGSGTPMTVSNVSVAIGPCTYAPPWGSNTIQPGEQLILTEMGRATACNAEVNGTDPDFDTSESYQASPQYAEGGCSGGPDTFIPKISITINGATATYQDVGQVLNTGGIDLFNCKHANEFHNWVLLN